MKKPARIALLSVVFFALSLSLRADVVVLVHGWASNSNTWLHSGVFQALQSDGYSNAGVVTASPEGGVFHLPGDPVLAHYKVYRVDLPAHAPLQIQAAHLYTNVLFIKNRHVQDKLILIGHSAGGIVSRLVLVSPDAPEIDTLITIASPNLGTGRALQGLDAIYDKPFFCPGPGISFLKNVMGGDDYHYLKHSQGALVGLTPAVPGTLIDWLNHQPHPAIEYHSIVRSEGDELVPPFSQDLNQVAQLKGRSQVHLTTARHALNPADGRLLVEILKQP